MDRDPEVRVVMLTNEGMVFCAGAVLTGLSDDVPQKTSERIADIRGLFSWIVSSPRPYVSRINGHCKTAELGLAAVMDFSVAIAHAKFGFTEVRVGVAPVITDSAV